MAAMAAANKTAPAAKQTTVNSVYVRKKPSKSIDPWNKCAKRISNASVKHVQETEEDKTETTVHIMPVFLVFWFSIVHYFLSFILKLKDK